MTSRSASGTGTAQQTADQPASTTSLQVEDHVGLVMHLAKRSAGSYQGQHLLDLEDLYQEGVLGLMHAAEKFDVRIGDQLAVPDDSEQREQQQEVAALLTHLSPREQRVIQTRYQLGQAGAYDVEDIPLPYTEVSRQLGMTTGLVKAVEARVLLKMRFWAERRPYVPTG